MTMTESKIVTTPENKIVLPTPHYSHHVAHGLKFDLELFEDRLRFDRSCGYIGHVLVLPIALENHNPRDPVAVAKGEGMQIIGCGFMPGNGPDPHSDAGFQQAAASLLLQIQTVAYFADNDAGPRILIGPWHLWHGKSRDRGLYTAGRARWVEFAMKEAEKRQIVLAGECLNETEDPDDSDPFGYMLWLARNNKAVRLHIDIGHLWSRLGQDCAIHFLRDAAPYVSYFEWGNFGRFPLDGLGPINIGQFIEAAKELPAGTLFGVEPFDPEGTIKPLGLQSLCPTVVPGREALRRDADFLIGKKVMLST